MPTPKRAVVRLCEEPAATAAEHRPEDLLSYVTSFGCAVLASSSDGSDELVDGRREGAFVVSGCRTP
jgi:hypothetical protein